MRRILLPLTVVLMSIGTSSTAQKTEKNESPYKLNWLADAPIIVGGIGLNALGVKLIANKKPLTDVELATKTRDKVPFFDRGNAGFYSEKADDDSYLPFHASFAMPVLMALVNGNERRHLGQVMVMYVETMAITGALFTMSAGNIYRSRPYVYGTEAPVDLRKDKKSQRSFYAGHTAASASATFFMAKVFADMNPDSKARPYVWTVAAAVPAVVGYLRYRGGMHFLSDNLLGYALGAGAGILVPELHKKKALKNITLIPQAGFQHKGLALVYTF